MQLKKLFLKSWHIESALLLFFDFCIFNLSYFIALWIRFDCIYSSIPSVYINAFKQFTLPYSLAAVLIFEIFRLYKTIWRYAGLSGYARLILLSVALSLANAAAITLLYARMPLSYYVFGAIIQIMLLLFPRFTVRFMSFFLSSRQKPEKNADRVMLIGAGDAGQLILKDISASNKVSDKIVCFIDDNPKLLGRYINGVPVAGNRNTILENVKKYGVTKIYLTMPSATASDKRDILAICRETDCELKQLPGFYQFINGQISVSSMKDVAMEDLLGRDPIKPDMEDICRYISGKTVLVTGGGGSIGSELCRQIAACNPKQLIVFDIFENNAYSIQLELKENYPDINLITLIGSVRDSNRLDSIFEKYRPQVVFHAAAHKHVPLMEDSPCESIKNNVIGTYKTAYAALTHNCEKFVLISTDKAVNPTNIMGASKRLCEMIIQCFDKKVKENRADDILPLFTHSDKFTDKENPAGNSIKNAKTEFVAVRFGNVLGSSGSVVPIFKKQIENGGPVTVTHPDIIRYFMTIPEAVSLVMAAGAYAHGGEIFVLDMGDPVKIDTLARNLIRLYNLIPDVDIKIEYTGLRPGEKLYEEKLMAEEGLRKTDNKLIHIGCPIPFDTDEFLGEMDNLIKTAYSNSDDIRELIKKIVTTYRPA